MNSHLSHPLVAAAPYSIGVFDLLTIAWRRKHFFLICLVVSLGLGALYYLWTKPTYEVRARLLLQQQGLPVAQGDPQKALKEQEFVATQAEILKSPTVVSQAAQRIGWPVPPGSTRSSTKVMTDALKVSPVMGTSVLSLSFRAENASLAKLGVQAIIDSYQQYLNEAERDTQTTTLEMLTQNEREVRTDLQLLEEQYAQLRARSPLAGKGKGGVDVHMALVEELGRRLADVRQQRIQLENQLLLVERRGGHDDGAIVQVSTAPAAPVPAKTPSRVEMSELPALPDAATTQLVGLHARLVEALLREKQLAVRFGHKHPDLRAAREQLDQLTREYAEAVVAGEQSLRLQFETIAASEQHLNDLYQSELETARAIDLFLIEDQQFVDQIKRAQMLHDSILDQIRQWKLTDAAVADGRSRVRVSLLEEPSLPMKPVWPDRKLLLAICSLIGLASASGLITVAECRSRESLLIGDSTTSAPQDRHGVDLEERLAADARGARREGGESCL